MLKGVKTLLSITCSFVLIGTSVSFARNVQKTDKLNFFVVGGAQSASNEKIAKKVVGLYDLQTHGICSATLIKDRAALTAAHCIGKDISQIKIIFSTDLTGFIMDPTTTNLPIKTAVGADVYPGWDEKRENDQDDIAIVYFAGDLPQGYEYMPVISMQQTLQSGDPVLIAGFGANAVSIDPKTNKISHTGPGVLRHTQLNISGMDEKEIFTDQAQGFGACNGDSGGPGYIQGANDDVFLWGVISRGSGNTCSGKGKLTNVLKYMDWINSKFANHERVDKF